MNIPDEETSDHGIPEYYEYYWDKAEEYEAQKDYENAMECYSKCFELSNTFNNAAYEYWWLQGIPEGYDMFRIAAYTKMADIHCILGDYKTAADYYLSCIKCTPYSTKLKERYAEIKAKIEQLSTDDD